MTCAHLFVVKHILHYLKGTIKYGINYAMNQRMSLRGSIDSDWSGSATNRKGTSRCCFSLVSMVISWFSRKQSSVALSTVEAEYIVACPAICEAVWLRKLLSYLFDLELEATCIFCDNQSCVKLSENPVFHDKSNHIEIKYHYIGIWCREEK